MKQPNSMKTSQDTSLYAPYRLLGLVCNTANPRGFCRPFSFRQGDRTLFLVPIDSCRALHLYDSKLRIINSSKPIPEEWWTTAKSSYFTAVVNNRKNTFLAIGNVVGVLHDMRPLFLQPPVHDEEISHMLMLGKILVTVSAKECRLITWDVARPQYPKLLSELVFPPDLVVTTVFHPDTYRNKLLVGFSNGELHLYNINTQKFIFKFKSLGSKIIEIGQSTQVDVVGIGCEDGSFVLLNLRADEVINTFKHNAGSVQTVDFRSDGVETVVTTTSTGELVVWDLHEGAVIAMMKNVHSRGASMSRFIPGEPILLTVGISDNTVKTHIFDGPTPAPRVLRARSGHTLPPTRIEFGHDADFMVTAGLDRQVRLISRVGHWADRALSQRKVNGSGRRSKKRKRIKQGVESGDGGLDGGLVKLPPVANLAIGNTRAKDEDFANIATCHYGSDLVYTWRSDGGGLHQNILRRPATSIRATAAKNLKTGSDSAKKSRKEKSGTVASTVLISPCGNSAMVGYEDGSLYKYSLQSGKYVSRYSRSTGDAEVAAHDGRLAALAMTADGDILISAGSEDRSLRLWDVHSRKVLHTIKSPFGVALLAMSKSSDLVAAGLADFSIVVYDAQTHRIVRKFAGHTGKLTDLLFDPPGRRLISSGMDGTIKTWDMVAGRCLDVMTCKNAPTALALAPSGDFLMSTHVNQVGVFSWIDRSKYTSIAIGNVQSSNIGCAKGAVHDTTINHHLEKDSLISLSSKPSSAWTTLANLDEIKRRNKPVEPVSKPKQAPFFLPSTKSIAKGLDGQEVVNQEEKKVQTTKPKSTSHTKFAGLVLEADMDAAQQYIESLGPSAVDFELRMISGIDAIEATATYFIKRLGKRNNWELLQAHLGVFLMAHGIELARSPNGKNYLSALNTKHSEDWHTLRHSFETIDTLTAFFTGQR